MSRSFSRLLSLAVVVPVVAGVAFASPAFADGSGVVSDAQITPHLVVGGQPADGVVTLAGAVDVDTVVTLSSTDTSVLTVPATVTVPAGLTTVGFVVTTAVVTGQGTFACVLASAGGGSAEPCLNVNPGPSGPTAVAISFTPTTVAGGGGITGTVTLSAPADINTTGITLTSSNPAAASVPALVPPVQGARTTPFAVTTHAVAANTTVTITATVGGVSRSGTLTVTAGQPPATDTVRITKVQFKGGSPGTLRLEATSSNPNAILVAHLPDDPQDPFRMTSEGNGRWSLQKGFITKPSQIQVDSNFGGTVTVDIP